jgi:hypothetical protein
MIHASKIFYDALFKGEVRRGMGSVCAETHPHPSPPLEGEGAGRAEG